MIGKAGGETADKAMQVQIRVAGRTAVTVRAVPSLWLSEVDSDSSIQRNHVFIMMAPHSARKEEFCHENKSPSITLPK